MNYKRAEGCPPTLSSCSHLKHIRRLNVDYAVSKPETVSRMTEVNHARSSL